MSAGQHGRASAAADASLANDSYGAANDHAWVDQLLAATPAPVTCWGETASDPAPDLGLSSQHAVILRLEQRLALMAEVLEERARPAARTAAARLRAIDAATLLALPPPEAQALLRTLLDGFRNWATALAAEDAAAMAAHHTQAD